MVSKAGRLGADALLLTNTLFWGITFVLVKEAIDGVGVFVFLFQRFALAFLIIVPVCLVRHRKLSVSALRCGAVLGVCLFGAYALQTMGLLYTTASNAAFLTGLNVVLVPVIGSMVYGDRITANMKSGVVLATAGLFLLCTDGRMVFNLGDLLVVLCAFCVAAHVVLTGRYARNNDVYWLTAVQIAVIALLSGVIGSVKGDVIFKWHPEILNALLVCALFATVFAFFIQTSMQRFTTPTHTALIFCMEPVFGALFAYWAIGERFGRWSGVGAALILFGMVLSEINAGGLMPSTIKRTTDTGT